MHTLLFLEPGHFHATLTLREPNPRVSNEIVVYAPDGPERRDFLALVERFNARAEWPTTWRPVVVSSGDPLARLIDERRGDVVVLAGRNGGKARTFRRLHEAGFHVLADKPWLVEPEDLAEVRASLGGFDPPASPGWPLTMEIVTGRHDVAARLFKRLVDSREVFGDFRADGPAIELAGVHCLEKLVDGAPLRRPPWYFDVRVQGGGAVDITTHVIDQTQWLFENRGVAPGETLPLDSARQWATPVPLDAFRRITGETEFSPELRPYVRGGVLDYFCNAELEYRIGGVAAHATVSWNLSTPTGGGDTSAAVVRGTHADVVMERSANTGHRRRLLVEPHGDPHSVKKALTDVVAAMPGVGVAPADAGGYEVTIPPALDTGHESHFARVLDEFLRLIDERHWPAAVAERTLAKYALLAEAAEKVRGA